LDYCPRPPVCVLQLKHGLEELFFKYGVDFWINGHEHDYERSFPMYKNASDQSNLNPKGTIYVVTGAAGSHELHEPFTRPQPPWSAFRSNSFGYSKIYVHNASHLQWQQIQTDPTLFGPDLYGRVIDDAWIVQSKHGPFDPTDPPTGLRDPSLQQVSYDHWTGVFAPGGEVVEEGAASPGAAGEAGAADVQTKQSSLEAMIQKFRTQFSNGRWKAKELTELAVAERVLGGGGDGGRLVWEDVRADGNSDGAAGSLWEEL
jgi:hypothetical protein